MLNHNDKQDLRNKHLGRSQRLAYDEPLHIVRGDGQHLFDEGGNGYLDCVNNVQHVGHCHPRVVAAVRKQHAKLNSNTRYLDDTIVRYAKNSLIPCRMDWMYVFSPIQEAKQMS